MIIRVVPLYPAELSTFDPRIGEVFIPGASGVQLNPGCWSDYREVVTINSKGLRDDEATYDRDDQFRILLLGDSFVEARQVPLEDTFHVRLEELLDVEVVAGGHHGWGTDNELLWYRHEGSKYFPDLVLLLYQPGNDVQDNSTTINYEPGQVPYFLLAADGRLVLHTQSPGNSIFTADRGVLAGPVHEFFLNISKLYSIYVLRQRRADLVEGRFAAEAVQSAKEVSTSTLGELSFDEHYAAAAVLTFALVDHLRIEVQADGSDFAVAIASADSQLASGQDNREVVQSLTDLGIPNVDLLPAILDAHSPSEPMHFACDGHWTAAGHEVVARQLSEFLSSAFDLEVQVE